MVFRKFMAFLFDSRRIWSHEIKSKKFICSFVFVDLYVFFLLEFGLLCVKAHTDMESTIKILFKFPAINQNSKCNAWFFSEGSSEHVLGCIFDEVFAVLDEENGNVSIFIENQIELKLRGRIMNDIWRNEGRLW